MKNGTLYAKRVRKVFSQLKSAHGTPEAPEPSDPVEQLVIGLLGLEVPESRAHRAAKALCEVMVDINEVRVSTAAELAPIIAPYVPDSMDRADAIRLALNAVFKKESAVSLETLKKSGRREARHYLESLDGVDRYAAASVILWSLGGHAIPVDQKMYQAYRKHDLVDPGATIDEVQAFLERNISAADAKIFCLLMRKFTAAAPRPGGARKSAAARSGKTKRPARPRPQVAKRRGGATPARTRKSSTKRTVSR